MENWRRYLKEARWSPRFAASTRGAIMLEIDPPADVDGLISDGAQKYAGVLEDAMQVGSDQYNAKLADYKKASATYAGQPLKDRYSNWRSIPRQPIEPEPEKFTEIKTFHVTLVPISQLKDVSVEDKKAIINNLQSIPKPELGSDVFLSTRDDGRKTLYIKVKNSEVIRDAAKNALPEDLKHLKPNEYMHMSIANVHGGDGGASVGDISEDDEKPEGKVIAPGWIRTQRLDPEAILMPRPKRENPPIPTELRPVGRDLRDKMIPTALIWPELITASEEDRPGMLQAVGLDQTQIDAVMGALP